MVLPWPQPSPTPRSRSKMTQLLAPLKGQKNRSPSPCSRGLVGLNSAVRLGFPVSRPVAFALVADIKTGPPPSLNRPPPATPHTSSLRSGGYISRFNYLRVVVLISLFYLI